MDAVNQNTDHLSIALSQNESKSKSCEYKAIYLSHFDNEAETGEVKIKHQNTEYKYCYVPNCTTYTIRGLYILPEHPVRKQAWIDACKFPANTPKSAKVCWKHFQKSDFKSEIDYENLSTCHFPRLHTSAVPNLLLPGYSICENPKLREEWVNPCKLPPSTKDSDIITKNSELWKKEQKDVDLFLPSTEILDVLGNASKNESSKVKEVVMEKGAETGKVKIKPKNTQNRYKYCYVPNCTSYTIRGLYALPEHPIRKQAWIDACKFPDNTPKSSTVCWKHFQKSDFKSEIDYENLSTCHFPRLHTSAVPNLLLPSYSICENPKIREEWVNPCKLPPSTKDSDIITKNSELCKKEQKGVDLYLPATEILEALDNVSKKESSKVKEVVVEIGAETGKVKIKPKNTANKYKYCYVPKCTTYTIRGLYALPEHPIRKWAWIDACQFPTNSPKSATVCWKHFQKSDFKSEIDYENLSTCHFPRLHTSAVPTLLLPGFSLIYESPKKNEINEESIAQLSIDNLNKNVVRSQHLLQDSDMIATITEVCKNDQNDIGLYVQGTESPDVLGNEDIAKKENSNVREVIMETSSNPLGFQNCEKINNSWMVRDASVFLKYCCPECEFADQNLSNFTDHAIANHKDAFALFPVENIVAEQTEGIKMVLQKQQCEGCLLPECVCTTNSQNVNLNVNEKLTMGNHKNDKNSLPVENFLEEQKQEGNVIWIQRNRTHKGMQQDESKVSIGSKEIQKQVLCEVCPILQLSSTKKVISHRREIHMNGGKICCPHCNQSLTTWSGLKLHIDAKHHENSEKKFTCDECQKAFIFEYSWKLHKLTSHNKKVCDICGAKFITKRDLHDHMITKHNAEGGTLFSCEKCTFSTPLRGKFTRHKFFKHGFERHKQCPHCDYRTATNQKLNRHIDNNHSDQDAEKKHVCEKCGKSFIFESSLTDHVKYLCKHSRHEIRSAGYIQKKNAKYKLKNISNPELQLQLKCDYCEEILTTSKRFKNHYKNLHPGKPIITEGLTKLNCTNCDEFFLTGWELDRHLNLDHEIQTKLNFCKKCKTSYTKEHKHCIKDNVYPCQTKKYLCNECGKCCTSKQHLQRHIEVIHEEVKHACDQCDKSYSTKRLLASHKQSVHENCKDFECKLCCKQLGSYLKLKNHNWQSHSQMTCEICGKQAANPTLMRKHKIVAHNETEGVLFCKKCPKAMFFTQSNFEKHMIDKHG